MDDVQLLYVEDSKASQRLFESAVGVIAECHMAASLDEARQLLASRQFTFFVIDYQLPDGNGLDLVAQLRADPRYANAPIILYAAGLDQDLAFRAMKAGVNDSLAKPMNILDLRERIVNLMATPTTFKTVRRQLIQMPCLLWFADGKHHVYSADFNHHIEGDSREAVRQQMHAFLEQKLKSTDDPNQYPLNVESFKCVIEMEIDDLKASA